MPPLDAPTVATLVAFAILGGAAACLRAWRGRLSLTILLALSVAVWLVMSGLGEFITDWATNNTVCYSYLGCNVDFFGFDAVEHLLFGFALAVAILWIGKAFPAWSAVSARYGRTIFAILVVVVFVAVCWEFAECAYDAFRISMLHEHLFDFKLHIDHLAQSSNLDTMGDIFFTIVGALLGIPAAALAERGILTSPGRSIS